MNRRNWLKTTAVGVLVLFGVKWRPRAMTLAEAVERCPAGGSILISREGRRIMIFGEGEDWMPYAEAGPPRTVTFNKPGVTVRRERKAFGL